jgi:hypothetical protein
MLNFITVFIKILSYFLIFLFQILLKFLSDLIFLLSQNLLKVNLKYDRCKFI